jgi:hypothetical protein
MDSLLQPEAWKMSSSTLTVPTSRFETCIPLTFLLQWKKPPHRHGAVHSSSESHQPQLPEAVGRFPDFPQQ